MGVNRLATKGEKVLLTTDKTRKLENYQLATKKLTRIYRQPTKIENSDNQICSQGPQNTLSARKLWAPPRCEAAGADYRNIKKLRKSVKTYS